jgi:hypothetical protein
MRLWRGGPNEKVFKNHKARTGDDRNFNDHVIGKGGDEKVLVSTWFKEEVVEKVIKGHAMRRRGD